MIDLILVKQSQTESNRVKQSQVKTSRGHSYWWSLIVPCHGLLQELAKNHQSSNLSLCNLDRETQEN